MEGKREKEGNLGVKGGSKKGNTKEGEEGKTKR